MNALQLWARKNNVGAQALAELQTILLSRAHGAPYAPKKPKAPRSEGDIVDLARLTGGQLGYKLFRNNVGVAHDAEGNRSIRYGLCNESKRVNESLKSSDLIGWRPVVIDPTWVGHTIAQFVAIECKAPGWKWSGSKREIAQRDFQTLVLAGGGHALFTNTGAVE